MELLFKRGLHESLPATPVEGAFYLTTDSHRLYTGIKNETTKAVELVDLNKSISVVADFDTLKQQNITQKPEEGDFAYLIDGNILAVYVGGQWQQINKNTDTTNSSLTASGADNVLTLALKDSANKTIEEDIAFVGTGGVSVGVGTDGTVTITGTTYDLSGSLTDTVFTIALGNSSKDEESVVTLQAGDNITFAAEADGITIKAKDTTLDPNGQNELDITEGNVSIVVADTSGNKVELEAVEKLYYTIDGDTIYNQGELPVYNKDQIDAKFNQLNPMRYLGTVANQAELDSKETGAQKGDTYMVASTTTVTIEGQTVKSGDLFIATGTEDETTGLLTTVEWTYVPSGDDAQTDTTYTGIATSNTNTHKVVLRNERSNADAMGVEFSSDGKIVLASEIDELGEGQSLATHISHGPAENSNAVTPGDDSATNDATVITVPTQFVIDSTGHVYSYKEKDYNLATYTLSGATVEAADNVVTITDNLKRSDNTAAGTSTFALDASADDNLNITASGTTISLKLEWGTF